MTKKVGRLIEDDPLAVQRDSRKRNHYQQHKADNDHEVRFELFLLDDGQQKVEQKDETRTSYPLLYLATSASSC
jgi:DNA-directed RNA polymerase II subunit RPB11